MPTALHIEVIDVALLPEYRGHGIGSSVLRGVLAHADRVGRSVELHVEKQSRAVRLYERLGFAISGDVGMYFAMSRAADQPATIGSSVSSGSSPSSRLQAVAILEQGDQARRRRE